MKRFTVPVIIMIFLIIFNNSTAFADIQMPETDVFKAKAVITLDGDSSSSDAKNPLAALGLSFFIPGAGQVYNGEILKGLLIFAGVVGLASLEIFLIRPRIALAENDDKRPDSLIELVSLIDKLGVFSLWLYGWGDAYRGASSESQLKLRNEKDNRTQNNIIGFQLYSTSF